MGGLLYGTVFSLELGSISLPIPRSLTIMINVYHSFSGAVYNQNFREERGPSMTLARTSFTSDCEKKLEEQKLKQILLSKLAKYKV